MASPAAPPPRPRGHKVNAFQLIALLLAFVLVAGVGGVLAAGLFIPAVAGAKAVTDTTIEVFNDLPTELDRKPLPQTTTFYASDGKTVLARFYDQNRTDVSLKQISPYMQHAMVAIEDKRFYQHGGIDVEGTLRALVNNATSSDTQGASTLTQQYVKNVLIQNALAETDPAKKAAALEAARGKTNERKLREAKLAISLEKNMTKDEILAGYLNIAQFGLKVYGVEAAAEYYFSTTAAKLTPVQAATIAGITQRPGDYDPTVNPSDSQRRRNQVLNDMYQQSYITKKQYDAAVALPIKKTLKLDKTSITNGCQPATAAALFCDYVTRVISNNDDGAFSSWGKTSTARLDTLKKGGFKIVTTISLKDQKIATKKVRNAVPVGKKSTTTAKSGEVVKLQLESALASVEPGSGKIVALAQNRPFDGSAKPIKNGSSVNFAADEDHGGSKGFSPGSSFKVFVLAEWLKEGHSLYENVNGTPRTFPRTAFHASCIRGWSPWTVGNSDGSETGSMNVLRATYDSVNAAYGDMETRLDMCGIGKTAESMGFRGSESGKSKVEVTGPSMALGTQNTSPLQQAAAYATLASNGTYCAPIAITSITSANGKKLQVPSAHCDSNALDPKIASTITYALSNVLKGGSAKGNELAGGRTAVGKTGTAQRSKAVWFVGYTPQLSTAVVVTNAEYEVDLHNVTVAGSKYAPTEQRWMYGGTISAPTWKAYMDEALAGEPNEAFPSPDSSLVGKPKVTTPPPSKDGGDKKDKGGDGSDLGDRIKKLLDGSGSGNSSGTGTPSSGSTSGPGNGDKHGGGK
ncbi:transglycosylase domain-containing protein [Luteimicrobium sp. NPDC057192]|uniref:transglycosylase domain-containing protein n=1 Tax=Luteimicrobium sp. NPDC057192 TaxID=3346042 RepID=UPI003626628E